MDLKSIILKGLMASDGGTLEQRAETVAAYIAIAQDLMTPAQTPQMQQPPAPPPVQPPPGRTDGLIVIPGGRDAERYGQPVEAEPPVRVLGSARPADYDYRTVDEIQEILMQQCPPTITVEIDGGQMLTLTRRIDRFDEGKLCRLAYPHKGDPGAPVVVVQTNQPKIDTAALVEELVGAAKCRYSANHKKVVARAPKPLSVNINDILANSPGGDADQVSDPGRAGQVAAQWAASRTGAEQQFIHGPGR